MIRKLIPALAVAIALGALPAAAQHDAATAGDIAVTGAFARATLANAPVGGAYLTVTNSGTSDDRLVAAQSPVAGSVELHEMAMENDVMKMRELPDGIPVPANGSVELKPGGLHVMLMGLKHPLVEGETFPLTLEFEHAGTLEVDVSVAGIAARDTGHGMDHSAKPATH